MTRQLENRMTSRSFVMELVEKALIDHEAVCTSKENISSIPELLVKTRGNMSEAARILKVARESVRPYARDFNCKNHIIFNGVLMIAHGSQKGKRGGNEAAN